jgi:carboxyl-terminal processing protease
LKELQSQNIDGIVIDLRGNGGGYLNEAVSLTGLFIEEGPVVQVRDTGGRIKVERDNSRAVVYSGPLAVIVDRLSASASEIFAAAIQDYQRGIVIGSQSFGKGTVQNAIDLNRYYRSSSEKLGQLKMTVAKFYRVDGGSTQNIGVVPDISLPSRFDSSEIGESSQANALLWDQIDSVSHEHVQDFELIIPQLETQHNLRVANNMEYADLLAELQELDRDRNQYRISLKEEIRRKEREESEKKKSKPENSETTVAADSSDAKEGITDRNKIQKDLVVKESAHILSDYLLLLNYDGRTAKEN